MKTCSKCGETKLVTEFHKSASTRDGIQSYCKACHQASSAKWRAANHEKARAANAAWCAANQEKKKADSAAWRAANRDRKKATDAAWQKANPEKVNAATAKWQAANPEAVRIHTQNRRAREREAVGKLSNDLSAKLFKLQRGKCACGCKQPLGTSYHIDHVIPLALGGSNTDDNIQLLTATCNHQKSAKHPVDFMQQRGFLI